MLNVVDHVGVVLSYPWECVEFSKGLKANTSSDLGTL
jgi:hypothetical protein